MGVKVTDSWPDFYEFEPSASEDPPLSLSCWSPLSSAPLVSGSQGLFLNPVTKLFTLQYLAGFDGGEGEGAVGD
ncbi:hypothetical protein TNCV_1000781 [Trichonephila clavipes]|nr:hypothetical protein TNCV_1000781 [Trichonephila clavipes]